MIKSSLKSDCQWTNVENKKVYDQIQNLLSAMNMPYAISTLWYENVTTS